MYCTNCQCDSCRALRLASGDYSRVLEDALRVIIRSRENGMTLSELTRYSRSFRTIDREQQILMLDKLVAEGKVIKHVFPAENRGRPRVAFLALEVSQ